MRTTRAECVVTGDLVVANATLESPPGSRPDGARALNLEAGYGIGGRPKELWEQGRSVFDRVQHKVFLPSQRTCKLHQHVKHIDLT